MNEDSEPENDLERRLNERWGIGGNGDRRDPSEDVEERFRELLEAARKTWENLDEDERADFSCEATSMIVVTLSRAQHAVSAATRHGILSPAGGRQLMRECTIAVQMALAVGPQAADVDTDRLLRFLSEGPDAVYADDEEGGDGADDS